jgi:hypothetical protein
MATKIISVKLLSILVLLSIIILIFSNGSVNPAEKKGQEQNILEYSYSGSRELGREYRKTMAESPRSAGYIDNALNEIDITLSDLLNLQLV